LTPSETELRRQLDRMLRSRVFAERPRSAELLRYFVEESIRNGCAPISQRAIAAGALGRGDDFSPALSAAVRVKIARLRDAIDRWYRGPGRGDPVTLAVSGGPYRLVATKRETARDGASPTNAHHVRRTRPMLVVVESAVTGQPGADDVGLAVSLRLASLLVEDSLVTVSGPLRRDRIAAAFDSAVGFAVQLGYDYVVEPSIRIDDTRWRVRMTITDVRRDAVAMDTQHAFDPQAHGSLADAIAAWIRGRIAATLAARE
jgi:hypothetical protein